MIICPRCSKENQDHYKFCLGCGADLPRDKEVKSFTAPTPPAGVPQAVAPAVAPTPAADPVAAPAAEEVPRAVRGSDAPPQFGGAAAVSAAEPLPAASPLPADAPLVCPSCGSGVPSNFKFCGSCGHDMTQLADAGAQASAAALPASGGGQVNLVLIQPDGTEGGSFSIEGSAIVGRNAGGVFGADAFLSPDHAALFFNEGALYVRDEGSLNGVYQRLARDIPFALTDGAVFRVGQELIRFESLAPPTLAADGAMPMGSPNPGFIGRIRLITGRQSHGNSYCVPADGMHLGRERGDVIFPDDGYVSGLHCRVHSDGGTVYLTDVGSSNGTFVQLAAETRLEPGSLILLGQQLFRIDY